MKKILVFIMAALMIASSLILTGCEDTTSTTTTTKPSTGDPLTRTISMHEIDYDTWEIKDKVDREITYKGIIKIGNTNPTSGEYQSTGGEYNEGLISRINDINFNGGVGGDYENGQQGYYIEFVHYDDKYSEDLGLKYTKKLIEEDEVFAIVGQFSETTIEETIDYVGDNRVIFLGAASGSTKCSYFSSVFNVHPLSTAEGKYTAQKIKELYPGTEKVGVIFVDDGEGADYKDAFMTDSEWECTIVSAKNGRFNVDDIRDCDVVVVGAGKHYTKNIVTTLIKEKISKPVFTSSSIYENAFTQEYNQLDDAEKFPIYTNAWLTTTDVVAFVTCADTVMRTYGTIDNIYSPYVMEGWIAADVFVEGLNRVLEIYGSLEEHNLTTEKYTSALTSNPVEIPMSVTYIGDQSIYTQIEFSSIDMGAVLTDLKILDANRNEFEEMIIDKWREEELNNQ